MTKMKSESGLRPSSLAVVIVLAITISSCQKKKLSDDSSEIAQQIGDVMASIDEMGGSSGVLAMNSDRETFLREESYRKTLNRFGLLEPQFNFHLGANAANAAACALTNTFGACSGSTLVRDFGNCTIGGATFSGTVTLNWANGAACVLSAPTDSISRNPNFTITGRLGGTLSVAKTGVFGQKLTWVSGSGTSKAFSFENDGIRRILTLPSGQALLDFKSETTAPISIQGTARSSNRIVTNGNLRVTDQLSGVYCDFAPNLVTGSPTCNCPVSGSWVASCSNGQSANLSLTGCGSGSFTFGSEEPKTVLFDRCFGI